MVNVALVTTILSILPQLGLCLPKVPIKCGKYLRECRLGHMFYCQQMKKCYQRVLVTSTGETIRANNLPDIPSTTTTTTGASIIENYDPRPTSDVLDHDAIPVCWATDSFDCQPKKGEFALWPNGTVPWINSDLEGTRLEVLMQAMEEIENKTCVKFVKRTTEKFYLTFIHDYGCWRWPGRIPEFQTPQEVPIGPKCQADPEAPPTIGMALHQIMHSLGFIHEHMRSDRDNHIKIMWDNIRQGIENDFKKYRLDVFSMWNISYDYFSVMHWRRKSGGYSDTIVPRDKSVTKEFGSEHLTDLDVHKINTLYGCEPPPPPPAEALSVAASSTSVAIGVVAALILVSALVLAAVYIVYVKKLHYPGQMQRLWASRRGNLINEE